MPEAKTKRVRMRERENEKCFPIRAKDGEKTLRELIVEQSFERYVIEALLKSICSRCLKRARVVELPYI